MASTRVREHVVKCYDSTWTYLCAGEGPSVVWLHGLWGEPEWELHHQRLAEHYTVYAPALPGYHGSSFPQWMIDSEDAAAQHGDQATEPRWRRQQVLEPLALSTSNAAWRMSSISR